MRKPSIHLNGTDAQSLFDGYRAAYEAIRDAQRALAQCAPNGRDYYVQEATPGLGKDATCEAMDEHRARMAALATIEHELTILAMHVQDAGGDKVRS
jgi:hypothetical protein